MVAIHKNPDSRAGQEKAQATKEKQKVKLEKLSSAEYTFTVTKNDDFSLNTTLTQVSTGKTKVFYQGAGSADSVHRHMLSLTDTLCEQWFNERPPKKPKKEKA